MNKCIGTKCQSVSVMKSYLYSSLCFPVVWQFYFSSWHCCRCKTELVLCHINTITFMWIRHSEAEWEKICCMMIVSLCFLSSLWVCFSVFEASFFRFDTWRSVNVFDHSTPQEVWSKIKKKTKGQSTAAHHVTPEAPSLHINRVSQLCDKQNSFISSMLVSWEKEHFHVAVGLLGHRRTCGEAAHSQIVRWLWVHAVCCQNKPCSPSKAQNRRRPEPVASMFQCLELQRHTRTWTRLKEAGWHQGWTVRWLW